MHIICARVSTEDQARHGYSLGSQVEQCRRRLAQEGVTENIEVLVDDGYSGEFLDRPAINRLRAYLDAGIVESVTFQDPDRMSRNLTNQLILSDEIEKAGARLMFVTGDYDASPEGKLFFAMKGAVSAYEKAKIRERTIRGKRGKAGKGKVVHNARPFGYGWDKEASVYVVDPEQAEVVRLIYDLFLNHGMGCRVIARELKERGVEGPRGKPLSDVTVHKVLTRELYCGTHYLFRQRVQKVGQKKRLVTNLPPEEWVPVPVPAIVSREMWEKAQAQLKRNRILARRNCRREYLLRGILRCALCGRALMGTTRPHKRKKTDFKLYSYYTCVTKESPRYALDGRKCGGMRIPVDSFEDKIWGIFTAVAKGEKTFADFMRKKDIPDYRAKIAKLTREHEELLKRHGQIAGLIRRGLLDGQAAEEELRAANREIAATKTALNSLRAAQEKLNRPAGAVSAEEILRAVTFAEKRDIVLRSGLQVHAVRKGGDDVDFYLE